MSRANETGKTVVDRRAFVRAAGGVAVALAGAGLFGCGQTQGGDAAGDAEEDATAGGETNGAEEPAGQQAGSVASEPADQAGSTASPRVMVVYFSATGHTETVAQTAAEVLGVEPFAVVPAVPYTADDLNYNDGASRVCTEHDDPARHVELAGMQPEGFDEAFEAAEVVLVGYPIWWGGASWVMDDFVAGNYFTGKTVYPFCTSASSPVGSSADDLAALCGTGDWQEGVRFPASADEAAVSEWLDGLEGLRA